MRPQPQTQTSPRSETPAPNDLRLRAEIRTSQRFALGLGVFAVAVGVPLAGNWGKGGKPLVAPPEGWMWLFFTLGAAAVLSGLAAVYLAMRATNLEARLPRTRRSPPSENSRSAPE